MSLNSGRFGDDPFARSSLPPFVGSRSLNSSRLVDDTFVRSIGSRPLAINVQDQLFQIHFSRQMSVPTMESAIQATAHLKIFRAAAPNIVESAPGAYNPCDLPLKDMSVRSTAVKHFIDIIDDLGFNVP